MFELLDIKWGAPTFGTPSGTINWSADLDGLTPSAGASTADLDAMLELAFDAWESVAAVDFEQVASGGQVSVTYDAMGLGSGSGAIAGVASWGPNVVGTLNSLSIGIIEFNSDLTWSPDGVGGVDFYAIALHEIGHIIGLDHVADPTQIMNDFVVVDDLGSGDIAGAQFIYGTGAASTPTSGGGGGGGGGGGVLALLLGLLALVAGVFTGGGGMVAMAAAAGRLEDDEDGENALDYLPGLPVDGVDPALMASHPIYVDLSDGLSLPMVEHECQPKACGCFGYCVHGEGEDQELLDWI